MSTRSPHRWPWLVWGLMLCGLAGAVGLSIVNDTFEAFVAIAAVMMIGYGTIGAFVASRVPGNPIGWLMLTIGAAFALSGLATEYVFYAVLTNPGGLPAPTVAAWLTNWTFILAFAPIPLILLLFPTGRLLSTRWRLVSWTIVGATAMVAIGSILRPGNLDTEDAIDIANPTGIEGLGSVPEMVAIAGFFILIAGAVVSVVALVIRYRSAEEEAERQQIRWLARLAAVAVLLLAGGLVPTGIQWISEVLFFSIFACVGIAFPAAIGYAILRHRLYDLDLVVKKTVTYSLIAIALTGFYLALVAVATVGNVSRLLIGVVLLALTFGPVRRAARSIADRVVYGRRATPYEVMSEFSERMAETYSTEDVVPRMAQVLHGATGAERADVWLRVGRMLRPSASSPAEREANAPIPITGDALPALPGDLAAEVRHQSELLGALAVTMPANDPLDPARERLVHDLAAQAGPVLRNVRLIEELRASRQRLVSAQDHERRRLERNIHDGAQQQLVALGVKLRLVDALVDRDPPKAHGLVTQLQGEAQTAIDDLRDLARGIYPPLLADKGLAAALTAQGGKSAIPVQVSADGIGRYDQDVESAVYFCCLEALQNTAKYAHASGVSVELSRGDGHLTFEVRDDGEGFDPETTTHGTGLAGIADRLEAIGGSVEIDSSPGIGTTVRGRLPVEGPA